MYVTQAQWGKLCALTLANGGSQSNNVIDLGAASITAATTSDDTRLKISAMYHGEYITLRDMQELYLMLSPWLEQDAAQTRLSGSIRHRLRQIEEPGYAQNTVEALFDVFFGGLLKMITK